MRERAMQRLRFERQGTKPASATDAAAAKTREIPVLLHAAKERAGSYGTADGLHGARELNHDAVACYAENSPVMLADQSRDNFLVGRKSVQRRLFDMRRL
jgi:hypothetical protein